MLWIYIAVGAVFLAVAVHDVVQRKHAILRNFPIIGHLRYILESVGPELRQYIVTDNDEERPFSRDQRRWIYASSKRENNYFGFGSDNEMERAEHYLIVKQSAFPIDDPNRGEPGYDPNHAIPCAKVMGARRKRLKAFRPASVVNVSGMSYGSLSGHAVEAMNRGCAIAGCLQSTGEGSVAPHHLHGGDLIWQIGTGYFGCRTPEGGFSLDRLREVVESIPRIRALEIKLSQGAKPGLGGVLPAAKITSEISKIRGVPMGRDCISPASHKEFKDVDGLLDFAERLAEATGLPVGIKSAVGDLEFWKELARLLERGDRGLDFITIDGGEGGTGAGPLVFADHVALPFKIGFARVYKTLAERGVDKQLVLIGSGKLGFPESALLAFALGCDMVAVGREAMMAVGCIQAQRCHTGHCPTGVATHNKWLVRGLEPTLKAARLANYILTLRKDVLSLCRACGVRHPSSIGSEHLDILDGRYGAASIEEVFGYLPGYGKPGEKDVAEISRIMGEPESLSRAIRGAGAPANVSAEA